MQTFDVDLIRIVSTTSTAYISFIRKRNEKITNITIGDVNLCKNALIFGIHELH